MRGFLIWFKTQTKLMILSLFSKCFFKWQYGVFNFYPFCSHRVQDILPSTFTFFLLPYSQNLLKYALQYWKVVWKITKKSRVLLQLWLGSKPRSKRLYLKQRAAVIALRQTIIYCAYSICKQSCWLQKRRFPLCWYKAKHNTIHRPKK